MQHTTLSDRTRLKRYGVREAGRGHACSHPPRSNPNDDPEAVSIPHGLAFQTRAGLAYTLRRVTPADAGLLDDFLDPAIPEDALAALHDGTTLFTRGHACGGRSHGSGSAGNSITLVATEACDGAEAVAAVAELVYTREGGAGEVEVVVLDDAQRKGIGNMLCGSCYRSRRKFGLTHLHGDMLAENYAVQRCIKALQLSYTATIQSGEMHIIVRVPEQADCVADARSSSH